MLLQPLRAATQSLPRKPQSFLASIRFLTTKMSDNPAPTSGAPAPSTTPSAPPTNTSTPLDTPSATPSASGTSTPNPKGPNPKYQKGQPRPPKPPAPPKKQLNILMLHGYTQSGPLFRAKTRALEKLMIKGLAPLNMVPNLIYPTAPNRLSVRDVPGWVPKGEGGGEEGRGDGGGEEEIDSWAWWRRDETTGEYRFLEEGMGRIAESIKEVVGGVDGVVGFSQGGSVAALLASAMERDRTVPEGEEWDWVRRVREANGGKALKFAVVYSGFWATPERLGWVWEGGVKTPTLHFIGSLDTVVSEDRSKGLVERCEGAVVVVHPGGHYVPVGKEWVGCLVGFVRRCVEGMD